jgi:Na+/proline symporter
MNANLIDYVAWAVILGVTLYVLNSGMKKLEPQELNKFYAMVIGGMMIAFFILAWFKTGYGFNKNTQQCEQQRFGYWKYACSSVEKKDTITGMGFF